MLERDIKRFNCVYKNKRLDVNNIDKAPRRVPTEQQTI